LGASAIVESKGGPDGMMGGCAYSDCDGRDGRSNGMGSGCLDSSDFLLIY